MKKASIDKAIGLIDSKMLRVLKFADMKSLSYEERNDLLRNELSKSLYLFGITEMEYLKYTIEKNKEPK